MVMKEPESEETARSDQSAPADRDVVERQGPREFDPTEAQGERLTSRSRRGLVGRHWWAQRWSRIIGDAGLPDRLHRGRSLARAGSVFNLRIDGGEAFGEVKQARTELHAARIRMEPILPNGWPPIIEMLCRRSHYVASLLAGILPAEIEDEFTRLGLLLFPLDWDQLESYCSCDDPADPCAHLAAVYYLVAERIDKDPFLLFRYRGCARETLLHSCREWRAEHYKEMGRSEMEKASDAGSGNVSLDAEDGGQSSGQDDAIQELSSSIHLPDFWGRPEKISTLSGPGPIQAVDVIDELGPPPGVEPGTVSESALREAYELVARFAAEMDDGTDQDGE